MLSWSILDIFLIGTASSHVCFEIHWGENKDLYYCYSITSFVNQKLMKSTVIKDLCGEIERPKAAETNNKQVPSYRVFVGGMPSVETCKYTTRSLNKGVLGDSERDKGDFKNGCRER
ncbi:hypothetical protein OROMI_006911 [Orobanche minor]